MAHIAVEIPESFSSFMDATVVRLQAIYPAIDWEVQGRSIIATPCGPADITKLRSEVLHTVYREKIYEGTLNMRRSLLGAVLK